jgi:5'-nucleotidase
MIRILVVNDDGVDSDGIIHLAEALRALGDVTVVAPDSDRSGTSHSISTQHVVTATERRGRRVRTYACSGTPADCVVLGVNELCGGKPDLVVSGINRGANLADDINYSGTVGAAVEAVVVGIPAMAVSLCTSWTESEDVLHWETAAAIACDLAAAMQREPLPVGSYWNVNTPNLPRAELAGVRFTRQGRKSYAERMARDVSSDGAAYFWVWANPVIGGGEETDTAAVESGYASITPLRIDRTDDAVFARYEELQRKPHSA